jgi:hypothetical protein
LKRDEDFSNEALPVRLRIDLKVFNRAATPFEEGDIIFLYSRPANQARNPLICCNDCSSVPTVRRF